jgi:hypothetical protein
MKTLLAVTLPLVLFASVALAEGLEFSCGEQGGGSMIMIFPDGSGKSYLKAGGVQIPFAADGQGHWRGGGGTVIFTPEAMPPFLTSDAGRLDCHEVVRKSTPAQKPIFPVAARSWGGKLRSGPSMSDRQVGSLKEGQPIMLLRNTGVKFNGYDWFEVRLENGRIGYQWGGIICPLDQLLDGAFQVCH